jgi:hypothetical protein
MAVKNKENNIIEYVFWEKGKIEDIEVDNPCTLILDGSELYISEPTQKVEQINVILGKENYNIKLSKGYTNIINLGN